MSKSNNIVCGPLPAQEETLATCDDSAGESQMFGRWARWGSGYIWWLILLLIGSALAVWIKGQSNASWQQLLPESVPVRSTYNKRQSGYSALYELCQRLGLPAQRWELPYRQLGEKHVGGTLVMISPAETPDEQDVQRLVDWLIAGNTLVYFDYFISGTGQRLLDKLGSEAQGPDGPMLEETIKPNSVSFRSDSNSANTWAKYVQALVIRTDTTFHNGIALATGRSGPVMIVLPKGKGRCLLGADPGMCGNDHIAISKYSGNFQFFINYLQLSKQPIYFDEHCHGYSAGLSVLFFLLRRYTGYVILQLLIVAAVAFASVNQRFGRVLPLPVQRNISSLEFIAGLASTYRRAKARDAAWAMIFMPFKTRLCKALGIDPHEDVQSLATAWSSASGHSASDYRNFLIRAQEAVNNSRLSEQEMLALISDCDRLSADLSELSSARRILGA